VGSPGISRRPSASRSKVGRAYLDHRKQRAVQHVYHKGSASEWQTDDDVFMAIACSWLGVLLSTQAPISSCQGHTACHLAVSKVHQAVHYQAMQYKDLQPGAHHVMHCTATAL
jgi:hypothetical protein